MCHRALPDGIYDISKSFQGFKISWRYEKIYKSVRHPCQSLNHP